MPHARGRLSHRPCNMGRQSSSSARRQPGEVRSISPVPVAPVIKPCRSASAGSKSSSRSPSTATSNSTLLPGARQPARPDHRRNRHRQDRHAAGHRRAAVSSIGVPGVHGRRQRRPRRHEPGRRHVAQVQRSPAADRRRRHRRSPAMPVGVLGRVRRAGPSGARDESATSGRCCCRASSNLNDTQQGVLALVFKFADDNGLLLLDLKDLRALLQHVGRQRAEPARPTTATSRRPRSARSSAACWRSSSRAATGSSASRC